MAQISVLVANAKGGCGKTTLATNLATAFANAGLKTGLAEGDKQRSSLQWLKRRPGDAAPIEAFDWRSGPDTKLPKKLERLVIDAPAGVTSKSVLAFLDYADLVVMPVLPSIFDEGATRRFLKKVDELKPIRKGRKPLAVVANRVRVNTRAARELDEFLEDLGHEVVTRFSDRALYQDVARQGLGIFDLTPSRRAGAIDDWLPLVRLIEDQA
ncbi:MAG: division plane positioning ATPase MipZ [Minwuia sp.]|uniref:nucleotide-binding protein n=1 Tax=Minwuia sp. TaxID=2493630 RepID=UPI003A83862A